MLDQQYFAISKFFSAQPVGAELLAPGAAGPLRGGSARPEVVGRLSTRARGLPVHGERHLERPQEHHLALVLTAKWEAPPGAFWKPATDDHE
ncbi:hypothetical protein ACIBQ1_60195 [Nonomuraea sp. NPDC050153]|uniref:hypothetical protein n=1 Tax=Nonomuraea sp. NPDC050153 TaxID=3364359 RepID=UPI0037B20155